MAIKGKDFKKAVSFIKEFLLKLPEDPECAELRDSLNLALLHMKKYFKTVWLQEKEKGNNNNNTDKLAQSLPRGVCSSSLHQDDPDRFHWKWTNADPSKTLRASLPLDGKVQDVPRLPLILQATKEGDKDLIEQLIEKEPSCVHAVDDFGRNAVMYAAHFDQLECLDVLLNGQSDPNLKSQDDCTACHVAVHSGNWEALERLIACEADVGIHDSLGRVPMHWAALLPATDCLELLLKCDVSINLRDRDGLTPAMWACHVDNKAHFDMITTTEHHRVEEEDGIERDLMGRTWIHWAVRRTEPLECLNSLLSPATAAMKDNEGRTVIHLAASLGATEACRLIVSKVGPDCLRDTDKQNRTCLHLATMGAHGEVVNFLLDHGADLNTVDNYQATAWDYAKEKDLHYCQMILNSYGSHDRPHSRGRSRHQNVIQEENNNNFTISGKNTMSQQQLSSDEPPERLPSPPHQPRPFIQGVPPPKRGQSPRRPSTGSRPSPPQDDNVDAPSNGVDYTNQADGNLENDLVVSPLDSEEPDQVQYRPSPAGDYVQSEEGAIINSDMQPSHQIAEREDQGIPPVVTRRRSRSGSIISDVSEQSVNYGMDVSDIEGEEGGKQEGRISERPTEINPHHGNHHPDKVHSPTSPLQLQPTSPQHQQQQQATNHSPQPLPQQPLVQASPRRLMPLGEPSQPLPMPLPMPLTEGNIKAGSGKGKKKKKKKSSSEGSVVQVQAVQPMAPVRSPSAPPEPEFGLRPPSPGFLPSPNGPSHHPSANHYPSSNHHPQSPTPSPRGLNRSPLPPPQHPHQEIAPIQGGLKTQQNRGGAWDVSWEPKRPGMPAPPVTPRDGKVGGSPGSLLPQAPPQGGLLVDRGGGGGRLSPRGGAPSPSGQSPRGGHSPVPMHNQNKPNNTVQSGLTDLQRPRTPVMPMTARLPDNRGRPHGSLPAHPPHGRP